jgi:hypothetical protein
LVDQRNQYDAHAQVIFRLRDQDGQSIPIDNADIFFVSNQQLPETTPIQQLIEDVVVSDVSRNVITFYLRTNRFDKNKNDWVYLLDSVQNFAFEITAIEPLTPNRNPLVTYVPLRIPLLTENLVRLIQPHRTTVIDVQLVRVPSPDIYMIVRA